MSAQLRPKILLADDDEVTREVLEAMVLAAGYDVEAVATGAEAVQRALSGQFAAVLLDYEMPEVSGLDATLRIRRLETGRRTPIIVLSAHTHKRERVLGAGANAYLVKPVTPGTLSATLNSWTSRPAEPTKTEVVAPRDRHPAVLELFFEVVPERLAHIKSFAARQDIEALRAEAHRLIGSCSMLGFLRMAAVARRLASGEIAPEAGAEQLGEELQRVERELSREASCSP